MRLLWLGCSIWLSSPVLAQTYPKAEVELKQVDAAVAQKISEFERLPANPSDKTWVKAKLAHMVDVDQFLRNPNFPFKTAFNPAEETYLRTQVAERSARFDRKHAKELKVLLKKHEWFKVSDFGEHADRDAWLLVQHADQDPAFQRHILTILEKLYLQKETSPQNYAYLFDRVASSFSDPSKKLPQRYGTQGRCTGPGTWEPHPMEDPKNLDARRKTVGLPPEAEYLKMFKDICNGKQ